MSVAAVAEEAGTTRQALYRRWPGKAELSAAALAAFVDQATEAESADPFAALVAELADFQRGVSPRAALPGRHDVAGQRRGGGTRALPNPGRRPPPATVADHPRTSERLGMIDADADLDVAVTMCTGSWYARALAGSRPLRNWPLRTAVLVWRAVGGSPHTLQ